MQCCFLETNLHCVYLVQILHQNEKKYGGTAPSKEAFWKNVLITKAKKITISNMQIRSKFNDHFSWDIKR